MIPTSKEANARYDAKMAYKLGLKLNRKTDADIIAALDAAPNKQAFVKEAIRSVLSDSAADRLAQTKGE